MHKTNEIAAELIFEDNLQLKVTKCEFKQLFEFATSGTHLVFNRNFYDRIDVLSFPICPWAIKRRGVYENLTKESLSCINTMLMIFFVCLEMKKMQKISLNFLTVSIKI